jgi:hypothetical protein
VVLLHEERQGRLIKTYVVDIKEKRLKPGPWSQADVGSRCMTVVSVPGDDLAAVAVGEVSVAYYKSGESKVVPIAPSVVKATALVDGSRVLLGQLRNDKGILAMAVRVATDPLCVCVCVCARVCVRVCVCVCVRACVCVCV